MSPDILNRALFGSLHDYLPHFTREFSNPGLSCFSTGAGRRVSGREVQGADMVEYITGDTGLVKLTYITSNDIIK